MSRTLFLSILLIFTTFQLQAKVHDICSQKSYYFNEKIDFHSNENQFNKMSSINLRHLHPKSHRSKPNGKLKKKNYWLIAWGDLGLVKYSPVHQQVVNEYPLKNLLGDEFEGELLAIEKKSENKFWLLVFNDFELKFEKILYSFKQDKTLQKKFCT